MSKKTKRSTNAADKLAAKKAAVLGTEEKKSKRPVMGMALCAVLVLGGAVVFMMARGPGPGAQVVSTARASNEFTLPAAQFEDGKARFYQYDAGGGLMIKYFVLKSSDGIIRAAFDACDSCWPSGKGYHQEGDDMVCNNCRRHFPSVKVNVVKGGCNPAPLKRTVRGDNIMITVQDILQGKPYFTFNGKG